MIDSFCKAGPESQTQANVRRFFIFTEHYGQPLVLIAIISVKQYCLTNNQKAEVNY